MDKVTITIFKHIIRLQEKTGKRLSDSEYAKAIGITRQSFASLMKGETMRIEAETIGKLTAFFSSQGMPITVADLFIVEDARQPPPVGLAPQTTRRAGKGGKTLALRR